METLRGAVALVTGGAGGIGTATSKALKAAGVGVVTADLPDRGADVVVDVRDLEAMQKAVTATIEQHGRLDVVVANAGIAVGGLVQSFDVDAWRRTIDINMWGCINAVLAAYPHFVEQRRGHIVFVASLAALVPTPLLVPYATAKSAVFALANGLRPEAARYDVGVTVVCPGPVETPLLDTGGAHGEVHGVDARRYLTSAAGKALPPGAVANAIVDGIRKNRAVVAPGRAGLLWRVARMSPALAEKLVAKGMRDELKAAGLS